MSLTVGRGGAREGAGRKMSDERAEIRADFEIEKARHERIKADRAQLDLDIQRGLYVERRAVVEASATAHAVLVQSFRSIRDTLERKYSLDPHVLDSIDADIAAGLENVAVAFRALSAEGP
jgi:hypothetical protein